MLFAGFKSVIATMWSVFAFHWDVSVAYLKPFQVHGGFRWSDDRRISLQRHLW
jgi:hypothetical protein